MRQTFTPFLLLGFLLLFSISCDDDDETEMMEMEEMIEDTMMMEEDTIPTEPLHKTWIINPGANALEEAQEAMILMEDNDTIHFTSGIFDFDSQLSIEGKTGVVVRGEGKENSILNFENQISGAQGILATNMTDFIVAHLSIQDPPGDGIKIKDSEGLSLINISAVYTGEASEEERFQYS